MALRTCFLGLFIGLWASANGQFSFSIGTSNVQDLRDSSGIIVKNTGITVNHGREHTVDPERELKINVNDGDSCRVVVLPEPLSQLPGKLTPSEFPCDFAAGELTYVHFGSRLPPYDRIKMQLLYSTATTYSIVPFVMEVRVNTNTQLQIVTRADVLIVDQLMGDSDAITPDNLEFAVERGDATGRTCKITILSSNMGLPRYGEVINFNQIGQAVDCSDFLSLGVAYRHTTDNASPRRDHIPATVEIFDQSGNLLAREYFQIMVRINDGLDNSPPRIDLAEVMLLLEVDQFVMTAITLDIVAGSDTETEARDLVFNITTPLGPGEGYIVSTDDRTLPLNSFTQADVQDLKIAYVPPADDSDEQRIFEVQIEVVDAELLTSGPQSLMFVVNPKLTLAPVATTNTGITLFEGQSRIIGPDHNLAISDEDNLDSVIIAPVAGLRHGQLRVNGVIQKFFTIDDLRSDVVTYHHDGTDTYSDNIIFRMTDGEHEVEFLFTVAIMPRDDEPPFVNVNTGILTEEGALVQITNSILSATDIDSDDQSIRFYFLTPFSAASEFVLRQVARPDSIRGWNLVGGFYERSVVEFYLSDITLGRLYYRHTAGHSTSVFMDRIPFQVADNSEPPNLSRTEVFVAKVRSVDNQPPYLYAGTTLEKTVLEFELTAILKPTLRYTDVDSNDRDLVYLITSAPVDLDVNSPLPAGDIVFMEDPNTPITTFTQGQVNHMKVGYRPPNRELGLSPRMIAFQFVVSDPQGNAAPPATYRILLQPVNNRPPTVTNIGFWVNERGEKVLNRVILNAYDTDTPESELLFAVQQLPRHGTFEFRGQPLRPDDTFSLGDMDAGDLVYVNSGVEETGDRIYLTVTDGTHVVPVEIHITIVPIDDEAPTIQLPDGALGSYLEVLEQQSSLITSNILSATDEDTEDLMLTFIMDRAPSEGVVEVNGFPVDRFTQSDIINGYVRYRHSGGEIGMSSVKDGFNLSISDMSDDLIVGGNRITEIEVFVTILPMDNLAPQVQIIDVAVVGEGGSVPITEAANILVTDEDTNDEDVVCTIVSPTQFGYLENISPAPGSEKSRTGVPISAFTVRDLRLNHINYVQTIHQGQEPQDDQFGFQCSDGANQSDLRFLDIVIEPTNDEPPQMFNSDFVVQEGHTLTIDPPLLSATDADLPRDELHFYIVNMPVNGRIVYMKDSPPVPAFNFTLEQIAAGLIAYEHDGSETTTDSVSLVLTDGKYQVDRVIPITILSVDDETPRLTVNDGLWLEIGASSVITNRALMATDLDSVDSNLTFVITYLPSFGLLQRLDKLDDSVVVQNFTVGGSFTQWELDNGRIRFVHTGTSGRRDKIKFDVTDGVNPLIDRYFHITIAPRDEVYPDVVNTGVELPEGGRVTLTTDVLSTTDLNSPDENLLFTITSAPTKGHLESSDNPGVPITSFTQLELAGNKIVYVHVAEDEMKMDSFQFQVTDGFNTVVRTFRISLSGVDNQYPMVTYTPLVLPEGGSKLITPYELRVEDLDTPDPSSLVFTVTQLPVHGDLLMDGTTPIVSFTMEDVYSNRVSYQHDGSETYQDSYSFTVTDGTHARFAVAPDRNALTQQPQRVPINIFAVDNGVPQMVINRGAPTLMYLNPNELGFLITNKFLRAEDRDSEDGALMYVVTFPPEHGYLVNVNMGNVSILNFTQNDLNNMVIQYILYPEVNATSDSYIFSIIDAGGNELPNQEFRLNWAFISLEREYYEVNETERYLHITLRRRGYLGETSFVGIETADGTAVSPDDFQGKSARQVQFNPGQTTGQWRVRIKQDSDFEQGETFSILLNNPVMGALEFPSRATVYISDLEDESTVNLDLVDGGDMIVEEDVGEVLIPIRRSGDLREEFMAICSTMPDTATGSEPSPVVSFSDYITRLEDDPDNFVRFEKGEDLAFCRVLIIDDSLYEDAEQFQVRLTMPMGGLIGSANSINIIIAADADDEPSFYFIEHEYNVDESAGYIEVQVWRTGTDLSKMSSITVRSRPSDPASAVAGEDYTGISRNLDFAPGVTMQTVRVYIQDDLGQPRLEGEETFELVLRMPMNAVLGSPDIAHVTINDTVSDLPKVQFVEPEMWVNENDGNVSVTIVRSGDLSIASSVRCYTRQGSAQVMMDYDERPNSISSVVTFLPGEREKLCTVNLMVDTIYEDDEQFRIVLGDPRTGLGLQAMIGGLNESVVYVSDIGDKPIIKFPQTSFTVSEPVDIDGVTVVSVPVIRMGDTSQTSVVRVFTKDGSAKSGIDYNPLSIDVEFGFGVSEHIVEIEVLPDSDRTEMREAFTVHLTMDEFMIAEIQMNRAIIYIQQEGQSAGVTFPSVPLVSSLRDYDSPEDSSMPRGYPVVCITACNPKHPAYGATGQEICGSEGLNDTLTQYRWMVSAPTTSNGVTSPLRQVDSDTFFTSTKMITLDSIYFGPGSRVQCVARPVSSEGSPGREASSNIVTINTNEGMCMPRNADEIGAEPFNARMRYTGSSDPDHPNKVRITITLPHIDGLLPAISTRPLTNFELALSKDGYRIGTHRCSNLLDFDEIPTDYGFITEETKNPNVIGEVAPYQFDSAMRGEQTLRFYRNLDLESCLWEFTTYYDMSELREECGGTVGTDGQVLDLVQSYVSMRIPLFVSYVFHSPGGSGGWQHFDQQSQMQLTFVYDTSILWDSGIEAEASDTTLSGNMYPTSMRIDSSGRLVVNFRTEALFNGLFVLDHVSSQLKSTVVSADHAGLRYTLKLVRSEPTFAKPEQLWQFVSNNAVSDYSGSYTVRLIPCTTSPNQIYDIPPICNPQQAVIFDLPIRFQQVSDPVPAEFSLATDFLLLTKEMLWLSDGSMGFAEDTDAAFAHGEIIYGRVHVDPVQTLGAGFNLQIEKVFLCSGRDGYIPKYDPQNGEYGCVADTPNLLYAFKILDFRAPDSVASNFNGVPFEASLAIDSSIGLPLVRQSGADGFTMSSNALYEVDAGRQWYLHAIYSLRSADGSNIFKREVHSLGGAGTTSLESRNRRASGGSVADLEGVGRDKGTNMHLINTGQINDHSRDEGFNPEGGRHEITTQIAGIDTIPFIGIVGAVGLALLAALVFVVARRRRSPAQPAPVAATIPNSYAKMGSNGAVHTVAHVDSFSGDNTEV